MNTEKKKIEEDEIVGFILEEFQEKYDVKPPPYSGTELFIYTEMPGGRAYNKYDIDIGIASNVIQNLMEQKKIEIIENVTDIEEAGKFLEKETRTIITKMLNKRKLKDKNQV